MRGANGNAAWLSWPTRRPRRVSPGASTPHVPPSNLTTTCRSVLGRGNDMTIFDRCRDFIAGLESLENDEITIDAANEFLEDILQHSGKLQPPPTGLKLKPKELAELTEILR